MIKKIPKKVKIFSLKTHKGAGILNHKKKLYGRSKLQK